MTINSLSFLKGKHKTSVIYETIPEVLKVWSGTPESQRLFQGKNDSHNSSKMLLSFSLSFSHD